MGDVALPEEDALQNIGDLMLVDRASALAPDADANDGDETEYWRSVHELHRRGTRLILDEAGRLTTSEEPRVRRFACDVLGQLGYEHDRPFAAETLALLARVCANEESAQVIASAISAMGHLARPESLSFVVAHAEHADPDVRYAVASALPWVAGSEWLETEHLAVTTLMQMTSDEDAKVRDWATFGLGTQVKVDGATVRQCLLARVDDPDEETRAEALVGLARRRAPEAVGHIRDALCAESVGRLSVESARSLGDPALAEALAGLAEWWDVDVDLLDDARRRCDPTRVDREADLVKALLDAHRMHHVSICLSSELLPNDSGDPQLSLIGAGIDLVYDLGTLMQRSGGSVEAAVGLIQHDVAEASLGIR